MKICFVDKTEFSYSFKDLNSSKLRGAEAIIINLSKEVSNLGHEVFVFNNCDYEYESKKYSWLNINRLNNLFEFDVVIANGDCNFFNFASAKKNILISHSNQPLEQFLRKRQLYSYIKFRPIVWMTSKYQIKKRSPLIKIFGHMHIPWSVDNIFMNTEISNDIKSDQAIFTSRPDRNLKSLIDIWSNLIHPNIKEKKLIIYGYNKQINHSNIINKNFVPQNDLMNDIKISRVYVIPGHKAETFCLAAEEAKELCIPIVTLGIGCLAERVHHGETGFIAKNKKEFSDYTIQLFNDDKLWMNLRKNLIKIRGENNWFKIANTFISQIYE